MQRSPAATVKIRGTKDPNDELQLLVEQSTRDVWTDGGRLSSDSWVSRSNYKKNNKKAELSQRRLRDASHIGVPQKFLGVPDNAHSYFSRNFNGLLFRSILWMCVQNLKFVALPVPETQNIWAVRGYANAPFSAKFLMGLCSDWTSECTGQIWSPYYWS